MNNEIKLDKNATEYLKDKLGGTSGTTVVANPELEGTEAELTGLEVDGTKYAVPQGGGTYYRHIIDCSTSDPELCYQGHFRLEIINTSNTKFDFASLYNYLAPLTEEDSYPCLTLVNGDKLVKIETCIAEDDEIRTASMLGLNSEYNTIDDIVIPM